MNKKIFLIPKDDLVLYPPTISLIKVMLKLGLKVVCIGTFSDFEGKRNLESLGVEFVPIYRKLKNRSRFRVVNWMVIIYRALKYKRDMNKYLKDANIGEDDLIWFVYSNIIAYIQKYIEKYNYVIHFYEFEDFSLKGKSRLLHPQYDVYRFFTKAKALIHCEYNRALITNGLYGLKTNPFILPNKPYESEDTNIETPKEVKLIVEEIRKKVEGKKVILYQGIFNSTERRLEEFCEAIALLPDNYVFLAMGGQGGYFEDIKRRYTSEKIIYIPFIKPPHHLLITQMAHYGILTYHPAKKTYVGVLNPLYCAPNKIFEFGKYGIPMVANDVPGLKLIFESYHCGQTISYPITAEKIKDTILAMDNDFENLSRGARKYYDSVDLEQIVKEIIS